MNLTDMQALLQDYKAVFYWAAGLSVLVFVGSLVLVPWIVVRIPQGYFAKEERLKTPFASSHPILRWTLLVLKNGAGVLLVLAGIAMLLLPGQGLLTIAVGVLLLDFPGKYRLESRLIRTKPIYRSVNWLRKRANVPPLIVDDDEPGILDEPAS